MKVLQEIGLADLKPGSAQAQLLLREPWSRSFFVLYSSPECCVSHCHTWSFSPDMPSAFLLAPRKAAPKQVACNSRRRDHSSFIALEFVQPSREVSAVSISVISWTWWPYSCAIVSSIQTRAPSGLFL